MDAVLHQHSPSGMIFLIWTQLHQEVLYTSLGIKQARQL